MTRYKCHYLPNGKMLAVRVAEKPIDCRSEVGVTIGLIDSIITSARVLAGRDLSDPNIIEALKDIQSDGDVRALMGAKP